MTKIWIWKGAHIPSPPPINRRKPFQPKEEEKKGKKKKKREKEIIIVFPYKEKTTSSVLTNITNPKHNFSSHILARYHFSSTPVATVEEEP